MHIAVPFTRHALDAHLFLSHLAADMLGVLNHPLADRHLLLDHRPLLHEDLLLPYRDADLLAGPDVGVGDGRAVRGMPLDDDLLPLHRDFDRAVLGDHLLADPDRAHLDELLVDLELLLAELNPRALAGPGGRGTRVRPGGRAARCRGGALRGGGVHVHGSVTAKGGRGLGDRRLVLDRPNSRFGLRVKRLAEFSQPLGTVFQLPLLHVLDLIGPPPADRGCRRPGPLVNPQAKRLLLNLHRKLNGLAIHGNILAIDSKSLKEHVSSLLHT